MICFVKGALHQRLYGSSMTEPIPFDVRMAALRAHFTTRARREGDELKQLAAQMTADDEARRRIGHIAHGLAGAGAIFGMPQVSSRAAELEEAILAGAAPGDVASQSLALACMLSKLGCQASA
jgi:HPt (histidine-containing phosphotransfer) domain-containing protein